MLDLIAKIIHDSQNFFSSKTCVIWYRFLHPDSETANFKVGAKGQVVVGKARGTSAIMFNSESDIAKHFLEILEVSSISMRGSIVQVSYFKAQPEIPVPAEEATENEVEEEDVAGLNEPEPEPEQAQEEQPKAEEPSGTAWL